MLPEVQCPFCWEPAEIDFDPSEAGPGTYEFVQDCSVCCHPWTVRILVDESGEATVTLERT